MRSIYKNESLYNVYVCIYIYIRSAHIDHIDDIDNS